MQSISSTAGLKEAIRQLEFKQAEHAKLLKEEFNLTRESLKPANLIKSTFTDVVASPLLVSNVLGTVIGLSAGYFSRKLFVGTSVNLLKKLMGNIVQLGVTTIIANKPELVQSFGQQIFQRIFRKRKTTS
jgi:hypothetical protein